MNITRSFLLLSITILIVISLEIISQVLFSIFGLSNYFLRFDILAIIYLILRYSVYYIAVFIFIIEYINSFFTLESWEIGTISGIALFIMISILKNFIDFTSNIMNIFVIQLFQVIWFLVTSYIIFTKLGNWEYLVDRLWYFIPCSFIISFLSPFCFLIFDKIWNWKGELILD